MVKRKNYKIKKGGNNGQQGIFFPNSNQNITQNKVSNPKTSRFTIEASGSGEDLFNKFTQNQNTNTSNNLPKQINLKVRSKITLFNFVFVLIIIGLCFLIYINRNAIKDYFHKLFNIKDEVKDKREVFNILDNNFTYDESDDVCRSINGSRLATYDQLLDSFKDGAEWCNYGWSQDGLALYPMQSQKDDCGKRGINGGYFDKNLKFGINCYGIKPDESNNSSYYLNALNQIKKDNKDYNDEYDDDFEMNNNSFPNLLGFNKFSWSKFN